MQLVPGAVACICDTATFNVEFRKGVGSVPVGGNSLSVGG